MLAITLSTMAIANHPVSNRSPRVVDFSAKQRGTVLPGCLQNAEIWPTGCNKDNSLVLYFAE